MAEKGLMHGIKHGSTYIAIDDAHGTYHAKEQFPAVSRTYFALRH
jgi:hypothetical protein